jgi:polar amino acid transport system substrate-binding protein
MGRTLLILYSWGFRMEVFLFFLIFFILFPTEYSGGESPKPQESKQRRTLYLCAAPDSLPYSSRDVDQPGYEVEIGNAVGKTIGMNILVQYMYAYRLRDYAVADCDLLMGAIQSEDDSENTRGRFFTSKPYYSTGNILVLPKGVDGVKSVDSLDKNQKIGIETGSWAHYVLTHTKGFSLVTPYLKQEGIIEGLTKGEIQAAVVLAASIGWYLKHHLDAPIMIPDGYVPEPELRWNVAIRINKVDKDLEIPINEAIDQLTQNKTIQSIMAKYGIPYYAPFPMTKENK